MPTAPKGYFSRLSARMGSDGWPLAGWAVTGFFIVQIIVDCAHSLTFFPFVHYGMYSEPFPRPDSIAVFEITVNGQLLRSEDFRGRRWDMIQAPLESFDKETRTGDFSLDRKSMKEGLQRIGAGFLYRRIETNLTNADENRARFSSWYKDYLGRLLGETIDSLKTEKAWYYP